MALTGDRRALVVATSQAAAAQRAHAAALAQASVRARAAAAANRLLAGSLALVGGPVGAAALAVGGLVWLATTAETTTEATRNLKSASDAVQGVLDGQADASGRAAKAAREQGIAALEAARAEITAIEEVQAARKRTAPAGSVEPVPSVFDRQLARLKANIATLESKLGDLKDREKEAGKAGSDAGDEVGKAFSESSSSVRGLIDDFTDLEEQAAVLAGAKPLKALAATRDIQDARDMIADLSDEALAGLREKLDELGISGETLEDRVARLIKRKRDLEDSIESTEDALERERKAVDEEAAAYEDLFLRKEKVAAQNDKLRGQRLDELHEREKEAAKKAAEEIARQAERAQEQFDRIVERSSSRIVDIGADTIFGTLRGESRDFWQDFEDLALRTFSQIAAEAALRPIIQPVVANVVGSAPGLFGLGSNGNAGGGGLPGAVGNLGNLASAADFAGFDLGFSGIGQSINAFGASIGFGGSAATTGAAFAATPAAGTPLAIAPGASAAAPGVTAASVPGAANAGALTSASLTSTLGAAGIGAAGGGILADLVGLDSTGGSIGGGLGAGIGFAVGGPVGGIVGGLAGSLGGGALGDLFGKSKPSRAIDRRFGLRDGRVVLTAAPSDEASDEQKRAFNRIAEVVPQQINQFVEGIGASLRDIPRIIIAQTRRSGTRVGVEGVTGMLESSRHRVGSLEEAVDFAIRESLQRADFGGLSPLTRRALRRSLKLHDGDLNAVQQDVAFARTIQQLSDAEKFSETELQIRAIKERFGEMIDRARELGLATGVLKRARDEEIAAIRKQAEATGDLATSREQETAARRAVRDLGGLQDLVQSLRFGESPVLTPEQQLSQARAEFQAAMAAVNDNEPGSLAGLAQAGTVLRDELRERFGSGSGFVDGARDIVEAIQRVTSRSQAELIQQAQVEATERQTEVLSRTLGEVRDEVAALRRDIGADRLRPARVA
ncbi:hypothetical protein DRB17_19260 [Ferruginivarius sediminum]|uniref:Bacteriophage tail tape measure N-terminal domain-containing protein n=1 Tax=Ferruginivarius sediminum TaxID=2661937 RepID=A0A369T4H1_9PROT|nr:hypothetical protein DRB17_19260 [Ferruginivarius sediminum]